MVCDDYYSKHPPFDGIGDRCGLNQIAAGTAAQFSILGMSTTLCGTLSVNAESPPFDAQYMLIDPSSRPTRHAEPLHYGHGGQEIRPTLRPHRPDCRPRDPGGRPDHRRRGRRPNRDHHHPGYAGGHHLGWAVGLYVISSPSLLTLPSSSILTAISQTCGEHHRRRGRRTRAPNQRLWEAAGDPHGGPGHWVSEHVSPFLVFPNLQVLTIPQLAA